MNVLHIDNFINLIARTDHYQDTFMVLLDGNILALHFLDNHTFLPIKLIRF